MKPVKEILAELEAYKESQRSLTAPLIAEALREARAKEQEARGLHTIPKGKRPLCGAKTRGEGSNLRTGGTWGDFSFSGKLYAKEWFMGGTG